MKEHPMLFSTPMVRAILEGRKIETRRPAKKGKEQYPPWDFGDRLWVREAFNRAYDRLKGDACYLYRADFNADHSAIKWSPPIHMPREACRLILEIDDMGVHRLQDMDMEDITNEGFTDLGAFSFAWDTQYSQIGKMWEDNPWVWCIRFHIAERRYARYEQN